jgi:hypothetical protein
MPKVYLSVSPAATLGEEWLTPWQLVALFFGIGVDRLVSRW